jgi:signal transduction histidine kinase
MPGRDVADDAGDGTVVNAELADAEFDDLLRALLIRVDGVLEERARWELLLDAVVTMAADLSLDGLLGRIVEVAGRLARARYAALGVLDVSGTHRLRTFVHHGMSVDEVARIGALPTGHGLLGLIIDRPEPLRLHDIAEHPASFGFPAHHPPMRSFLGVPIRVGERIFGNLYLTEKEGNGDFSEQDEHIVVSLAAAAGVAIENSLLHEEAARRERWLAATAEISALLVDSSGDDNALQTVADRALELSRADAVWIVAGSGGRLAVQVVSGPDVDMAALRQLPLEDSLAADVIRSEHPLSIDDLSIDARAMAKEQVAGWPRLGPALIMPLRSAGRIEGALTLGWAPDHAHRYLELDAAMLASFVEHAALALQIARAHHDKERLVLFEDRDRIARDLHDSVIQSLFAIGLTLDSASRLTREDDVRKRLDVAVEDIDATIRDIRRSIFELGSSPRGGDVQSEVANLVERAAASLKFRPGLTFEGPVRTLVPDEVAPDLLAVLREALSNAARHAGATRLDVLVSVREGLCLVVDDDGRGIPEVTVESGLSNIRERAARLNGRCEITTSPLGGTRVEWTVPL